MKHARLHRADRTLGDGRDFLERMAHLIGELEGQTLFGGQLVQPVFEPILNLGVERGVTVCSGYSSRLRAAV